MKPLAVTTGDPAGIGPDLVLALPQALPDTPLVVLGDRDVLDQRAHRLGLNVALTDWMPGDDTDANALSVWHCPAGGRVEPGRPEPGTATATLTLLERAADGCLNGDFGAMVTAPLAKSVIREGADANFTGHTEFLAERAGVDRVVMMLTAGHLRVALATTHLPLRAVPDAVTRAGLAQTLDVLDTDLRRKFGCQDPRILVLGLNPHAGESGHLGREETELIEPELERLRGEGLNLTGPVPADTAFTPDTLAGHDAVLALYHDQGLPVLKYAGFGEAVNVTLGLPFVRTSVDHGTAWALAGTGRAHSASLVAAARQALHLSQEPPP
jgi:4-hydroxythreonine-4-phosphate dehydrogenase